MFGRRVGQNCMTVIPDRGAFDDGGCDAEADLEDLIDASTAIGFVPKSRLSATAIAELLNRGNRADGSRSG